MEPQLVELDPRRRTTVRLGRHSRYLVTEEADGSLIFRPAVIVTEDELALLNAPWLVEQIEKTMAEPRTTGKRRTLPVVKD